MNIRISALGKRYNFDWIFRNFEYEFLENNSYAIIGANGSGKSTLAKVIASFVPQTEGQLKYDIKGEDVEISQVYQYLNFAAPYLELIEDFTLREHFDFHCRFKKAIISFEEFTERLKLTTAVNKQIKFFSSGMKQRIKLGFSFFFESKLLILDEPSSNLDLQGFNWYQEEVMNVVGKRTILVCSNQTNEYDFCKNYVNLEKLK